jgi:hypothetical protein
VAALIEANVIENNGDHGVYLYTNGNGDLTATMTNNQVVDHYSGVSVKNFGASAGSSYNLAIHHNLFQNNLNADNDAAPGFWDDGLSAGNCWSDFSANSGYPTQYNISGNASAVDRYPNVNCGSLCDCQPGNPNNDQFINLKDITFLINFLYRGGPPAEPYDTCSADPNVDCLINIKDITFLINFLYRDGLPLGTCANWWSKCGLPIRQPDFTDRTLLPERAVAPAPVRLGQSYR